MVTEKRCNCCGNILPLSEFYYNNRNKCYYKTCKVCVRKRAFERYWEKRSQTRTYRTILYKLSTLPNEEWRSIKSEERSLFISSIGRVAYENKFGERYLFLQRKNGDGYLEISSHYNITKSVHRLVAMAFIGEIPQGMEINHKNGIKTDNRVENLEIVTHVENMHHARDVLGFDFGTLRNRKGKKHHLSKPVLCCDRNGNVIQEYESIRMAAEILGLSPANISSACKKKYGCKTCGGYVWCYK